MQAASSNATALARSRALLGRTLRRRKSTAAPAAASFADEDTHDSTSDPGRAPHYPHLFQPLSLGPAIGSLPNRCIMGSMHTGLEGHSIPRLLLPLLDHDRGGHHDGHGDDGLSAMAEYFRARAEGGCGLMVTGGISPNRAGWVSPFAAKLSTRAEMERHRVVADAVHSVRVPVGGGGGPGEGHRHGHGHGTEAARICLQILHTGRYGHHPFAVSASATRSPISPFRARELSISGVRETVEDFVNCAVLAREAGYDGVEIMGSEGYLINQFLAARTNRRTDEYGGPDFRNRMRFAVDIVRETRMATGPDFILIFRLSMLDLVKDGSSWEEVRLLAQAVEDAGATIINTGIGWHEARVPTIATSVPRGTFSWVTRKLREERAVSVPLCATNRINAPRVADGILGEGDADLISMARPFLADPDILKKAREGRPDDVNTCIACNQACLDHAFVGRTASCLVNPLACHETELAAAAREDSLPAEDRRRIGVLGAGPAGLAFATTAATIGHQVTLYDNADEIGGQFNMAKRIPGKEEFHETLRYFNHRLAGLERSGKLEVRLGTEVRLQDMLEDDRGDHGNRTDKWILAAGVDPRTPPIPGVDHPSVLSYIDVLRHDAKVGRRVAIIGAGGIGFDVAEFLLHHDRDATQGGSDGRYTTADEPSPAAFLREWGVDPKNEARGGLTAPDGSVHRPMREIIMMQRKKGKLGAGLGKTTGWIHRAALAKSGAVEMVGSCAYEKVDAEGRLHISVGIGDDATTRVLDVDNIILCAGQIAKKDLEMEAEGTGLAGKLYTIGGAYEAGELDAKRAIDMGTRLALKIHEDSVIPGQHNFQAGKGPEEAMIGFFNRWM